MCGYNCIKYLVEFVYLYVDNIDLIFYLINKDTKIFIRLFKSNIFTKYKYNNHC